MRSGLHRIDVNRAIDHTRARALRRGVAVERAPAAVAPEPAAPDEELLQALTALGVEQRAVVVLRHLLGYAPAEIARRLDLPRGTVNSRLRRGLDSLATELDTGRALR